MEDINDFLKDWLEGRVPPSEIASRKASGDSSVNKYEELITRSSHLKVPEPVSKEDAWAKLSGRLSDASPAKEAKVVKFNRWIPVSIAASITLLMVALFSFSKITVSTQMAETKVHVLPDGSEVTLNADSEISFRRWWIGERAVALKGEAFFNVKKGSSFSVATANGTVTVLGTSFNVNARDAGLTVSCYTGKVEVAAGNQQVILTQGLFTHLHRNALAKPKVFDYKRATWTNGDFYFEAVPLREVIRELERQFGVTIEYTGDGGRLYTGYFNRGNQDEAFDMVFKPMALKWEQTQAKRITVK
jgi:transmembrane sensor